MAVKPSRRYRGLYIVSSTEAPRRTPPRLTRVAQTKAIVAQVGREIEQQAARAALQSRPQLLPPHADVPALPKPASPIAAVRRLMLSILPGTI